MKTVTLCFLIDKPKKKVLLGLKKVRFGAGKWNGFGGHVENGENIKDAAIRELREESSMIVDSEEAEKVGELTFYFPHKPEWNQIVHVFSANAWTGEPKESDEMSPKWFGFKEIPFDKMWADDKHWLPKILAGKKVKASFVFNPDSESIADMKLDENGTDRDNS